MSSATLGAGNLPSGHDDEQYKAPSTLRTVVATAVAGLALGGVWLGLHEAHEHLGHDAPGVHAPANPGQGSEHPPVGGGQ